MHVNVHTCKYIQYAFYITYIHFMYIAIHYSHGSFATHVHYMYAHVPYIPCHVHYMQTLHNYSII